MTKSNKLLIVLVAVAVLVAVYVVPASAQSSGGAPKATEIGVTATEIKIAVMADVDNPFVPGLFQGDRRRRAGAAKYLNSKAGGGGVAGRKLVVDFIDSKLNPNQARNGVITACQNDFALVGTSALFLPTVDDEVNCKDQAGAAHRLARRRRDRHRRAAVVLAGVVPREPAAADLQHQGRPPADLLRQPGRLEVPAEAAPERPARLDAQRATTPRTRCAGATVLIDTAINAGIKSDQNVTLSGRDPQSAYTPVVNQMKNRRLELLAHDHGAQQRGPVAQRSAAPGAHQPGHRVGVHDLLRQDDRGARRRHEQHLHAP